MNAISLCTKHQKFKNLVVLERDGCILCCPKCYIKSDVTEQRPEKGIFICEESRSFFKQWTASIVQYFRSIIGSNQSIYLVLNFDNFKASDDETSRNDLAIDQASRVINVVLQQQIAVFQGNLGYVSNQSLQLLTHHVFLMDLYNMVMCRPEKTLEVVLDKFKKTFSSYYKILRLPLLEQRIKQLQFNQTFVQTLNSITDDKMRKYSSYFLFDMSTGQVPQFTCFKSTVEKVKPDQMQEEAISENEDEQEKNSLRISEILEKKVVVGHDKQKQADSKSSYGTPRKEPKFKLAEDTIKKQISIEYHLNMVPSSPSNLCQSSLPSFQQKSETSIKIGNIILNLQGQNQLLKKFKGELIQQVEKINNKILQINQINKFSQPIKHSEQPKIQKDHENLMLKIQDLENQNRISRQQINICRREIQKKEEAFYEIEKELVKIKKATTEQIEKISQNNKELLSRINDYEAKIAEGTLSNQQLMKNYNKIQAGRRELELKFKQSQNIWKQRQMKLQSQIYDLSNINQEFIKLLDDKNRMIDEMQLNTNANIQNVKDSLTKQFQILHLLQIEELNAAKREVSELKDQIKEVASRIQNLLEEKDKQRKDLIASHGQREQEMQRNFRDLEKKVEDNQNFVKKLVQNLFQKQKEIEQLVIKILQLGDVIKQQETKPSYQDKAVEAKEEDKNDKIDSDVKQILWNLVIEQMNTNISELNQKNQQIVNQLMQKDKTCEELNKIVDQLKNIISSNQKRLFELSEKEQSRENKISAIMDKNQSLEQVIQMQIQKGKQLIQINKCLISLNKRRQQQIDNLKQEITKKQEVAKLLQAGLHEIKSQKQQFKASNNSLIKQKENLQEVIKELKDQLQKLIQQINTNKVVIDNLNQKIIEKSASHEQEKAQILQESANQNKRRQQEKLELQNSILKLGQKIMQLESEIERCKQSDDEILEELINTESDLKAKQFEIDRLLSIYYEIAAELGQPKRTKYLQAVAKYKPSRVKTQ